jgi:hypothetical protein
MPAGASLKRALISSTGGVHTGGMLRRITPSKSNPLK